MRVLIILGLVFLCHFRIHSQVATNNVELKKIEALIKDRDYESARIQLNRVESKYAKNKNALYARLERLNGILFERIGELDSAEYQYTASLRIYDSLNMYGHMHDMYSQLGVLYSTRGDKNQALIYYQKALDIALDEGNLTWQMKLHCNISNDLRERRDFTLAITHAEKAWSIAYNEQLAQYFPHIKNLLGTLLLFEGNYKGAIEHFRFLLEEGKRVGNEELVLAGYQNISSCYFKLDEYDKSMPYARKSYELSVEMDDYLTMCSSITQIGHNFYGLNQLDSAAYYYKKALYLAEKYKLEGKISNSLGDLAKTYIAKKEYSKAKKNLTLQRVLIAKNDNNNSLGTYYQSMINVLKGKGKDKLVISYLDSLILHKNKKESTDWSRVERLEFEQEVKQLEKEKEVLITGLESENGSLKASTYILIVLGFILTIVLIVQVLKRMRMRNRFESISIKHSEEGNKLKNQIDEINSPRGFVDNKDFSDRFNLLTTLLSNKLISDDQKISLTNREIQICVLIAYGCPNNKALWILSDQNNDSYSSARYRIRKKLNTKDDHDLKLFLLRLMNN